MEELGEAPAGEGEWQGFTPEERLRAMAAEVADELDLGGRGGPWARDDDGPWTRDEGVWSTGEEGQWVLRFAQDSLRSPGAARRPGGKETMMGAAFEGIVRGYKAQEADPDLAAVIVEVEPETAIPQAGHLRELGAARR